MATEIDPHDLILAVKRRQLLYDRNHELYGNRNYTNNAWKEIAEEINTDEFSARRKWTALRDYFSRQYRLVHASKGSTKKIRWCFYKNLYFLRDFLDAKPAVSSPSVKLDYDPACAEDTESASIINATQIKSQVTSSDEEEAETFDALEEEKPPQQSTTSSYRARARESGRSRQKRTYVEAHGSEKMNNSTMINNNSSNQNNTNNGEDEDFPPHFDGNSNNSGSGGISMQQQIMASSYHDSPSSHVMEEDHDELFLKSLLPDLKCVTDDISKMECKIEMQGVVLKFIRQSRNLSNSNSAHSNNQNQSQSYTS